MLTQDDKCKIVRALVETDQIKMITRSRQVYFYATDAGAKILEVIGIPGHKSEHGTKSMPEMDFGPNTTSISSASLMQALGIKEPDLTHYQAGEHQACFSASTFSSALGAFRNSDVFHGIKEIPKTPEAARASSLGG